MPKIRYKSSGTITKSGSITKVFRKVLNDNEDHFTFLPIDKFHYENKKSGFHEYSYFKFNDKNTVLFEDKSINNTFDIEPLQYTPYNKLHNQKAISESFPAWYDNTYNINKSYTSKSLSNWLHGYEHTSQVLQTQEPFNDTKEREITELSVDITGNPITNGFAEFDRAVYDFKNDRYIVTEIQEKEINVDFNKDYTYMSFNLNSDASDTLNYANNNKYRRVRYPSTSNWNNQSNNFIAWNNNTLYLQYGSEFVYPANEMYTIGDGIKNYTSGISDILSSCITHNPYSYYETDLDGIKTLNHVKSLSNPISDFGFPFENKYRGENEVLVPMKNFIKSNFVIEKISVEFGIQNFAISNNENIPCINFLNFFILNQRGSIEKDNEIVKEILQGVNVSNSSTSQDFNNIVYYDDINDNVIKFQEVFRISDDTSVSELNAQGISSHIKHKFIFESPYNDTDFDNAGTLLDTTVFDNKTNKIHEKITTDKFNDYPSREIITSIKIVNIGKKIKQQIENNESFKYFNTLDSADAIVYSDSIFDSLTSWDNNTVYDILINDDFQKIKVESNLKAYKENKFLKRFSNLNVYPKQRNYRNNMLIRSDKSYNFSLERIQNNNFYADQHGSFQPLDFVGGKTVDIYADNQIDSPYIVSPDDNLIFGFNFAPNMQLSNESDLAVESNYMKYSDLTGRDVIVLDLRNLKVKLKGHYVANKESYEPKETLLASNKYIKKINEHASNVTDQSGFPLQYMLKGNYFNRYTSNEDLYPNRFSKGTETFINLISIPQNSKEYPWGLKDNAFGINPEMYGVSAFENLQEKPPLSNNYYWTEFNDNDNFEENVGEERIIDNNSNPILAYDDNSGDILGWTRDPANPSLTNARNLSFQYKTYNFNPSHFGYFSDKLNSHTHYAYQNKYTSKETFNVVKHFRKTGNYTQYTEEERNFIEDAVITNKYWTNLQSRNNDIYSRLSGLSSDNITFNE